MKNLLYAIISVLSLSSTTLYASAYGEVTLLLGPSTAGKTTIIANLIQDNPALLNFGLDEYIHRYVDQLYAARWPDQYKSITRTTNQSVCELIADSDDEEPEALICKDGVSAEEKGQAQLAIEQLIELTRGVDVDLNEIIVKAFDEMMQQAQQGKAVVMDMVEISQLDLLTRYPSASFNIRLVFCPFAELSERLLTRNAEAAASGVTSNMRIAADVLGQYAELYRPKENDTDIVLETLCQDQARRVMNRHDIKESTRIKILEGLGFTSPDIIEVAITSRFQGYTEISNTGKLR